MMQVSYRGGSPLYCLHKYSVIREMREFRRNIATILLAACPVSILVRSSYLRLRRYNARDRYSFAITRFLLASSFSNGCPPESVAAPTCCEIYTLTQSRNNDRNLRLVFARPICIIVPGNLLCRVIRPCADCLRTRPATWGMSIVESILSVVETRLPCTPRTDGPIWK